MLASASQQHGAGLTERNRGAACTNLHPRDGTDLKRAAIPTGLDASSSGESPRASRQGSEDEWKRKQVGIHSPRQHGATTTWALEQISGGTDTADTRRHPAHTRRGRGEPAVLKTASNSAVQPPRRPP